MPAIIYFYIESMFGIQWAKWRRDMSIQATQQVPYGVSILLAQGSQRRLPDLITYTAEAELNPSSILASVAFAVLGKYE